MTEPIAVDVPPKSVPPRPAASVASTLAGLAVGAAAAAVLPVPVPAVLPKIDSPPKPADLKPAPGATAEKPPEAAPANPQAAEVAPTTVEKLLAKFTKRQLTIGASAVFSLIAGIGAVRLMFPAKETPPTAPTTSLAATDPRPAPATPVNHTPAPQTPAPPELTLPLPKPRIEADTSGFTPIPNVGPVAPPLPSHGHGAGAVAPAASAFPPPTITPERPAPIVPTVAPSFEVPVAPAPVTPNVFPASGTTPMLPIPTAPATPPVAPAAPPTAPALPPLPGMGAPSTPTAPTVPTTPPTFPLPAPPTGMGAPAIPAPPDLAPPLPMTPSPAPTTPTTPPALPAIPPTAPATPPVSPAPMTPSTPLAPPSSVVPVTPSSPPSVAPLVPSAPPSVVPDPGRAPGAFPPVDVVPKPEPPKVAPNFDPPGVGTPAAFTKPGGATDVKPVVATSAPKTDFDVDLYDPKANDSYESISQDVYNDKRYAAALKAFNRNQQLQGGRLVELPPIYVLKRRFPNVTGGAAPGGGTSGLPTSAQPNWGPAAGELVPAQPEGKRGVFMVPAGPGMTLRTIARQKLGSEQRWRELYDLNLNVTRADEVLPPGTEVKLPADAR